MKVIIVGGLADSLIRFRGDLIRSLSREGYEVIAMAGETEPEVVEKIEALGCRFLTYPIARSSLNPLSDIRLIAFMYRFFRKECPDVIITYTIKPVIWGNISSMFSGIQKRYSMITGLGFAFQKGNWKKNLLMQLVIFLYKVALKNANKVIFQNKDNRQAFIDLGIVPAHKTCIVNGSGVDVKHFGIKPLSAVPSFLLIARLLGDKGIREYVAAANKVKQDYPDTVFQLVGPEDPSPDGISLEELSMLNINQSVDYLGSTNDVRSYIECCNVFVLPSYHEGLPRTVLEAMATGRPILTTNVPGCRETVINNVNGWLVEKANVDQLAERMIWFIENPNEWQRMAQASREIVEDKFDVHKVNKALLTIMELDK